jgi:hypothetical protein
MILLEPTLSKIPENYQRRLALGEPRYLLEFAKIVLF